MRKTDDWGSWNTLGYLEASEGLRSSEGRRGPSSPSVRRASNKLGENEARKGLLFCLRFTAQKRRKIQAPSV